jgi:hypothetical protein
MLQRLYSADFSISRKNYAPNQGSSPQNGEIVRANNSIEAKKKSAKGLVVDDESKCPVSGKRKYASEVEALATAAHQIATATQGASCLSMPLV